MGKEKTIQLPSLQRLLAELGENIRLARLRRRFSAVIVAERAGIARNTLRAVERGDSSVSFGAYANVLFSLGLEKDLRLIARDDELGRKLQDLGLPIRARAPRVFVSANSAKKPSGAVNKPKQKINSSKEQKLSLDSNLVKKKVNE